MILTTLPQYIAFLFSLATATVLIPRGVPHVVEDIAKAPYPYRRRDAIPVSNGTVTSQHPPSTITPAPTPWPMYSRPWPPPDCDIPPGTSSDWCRVNPGTVQLHFWPTGAAAQNLTFPSTYYLSEFDVTMTSPSVYYIVNLVTATDYCGQEIGPPVTNFVHSLDLTDVTTLQPYSDSTAKSRIGPPQQLELSDLSAGCPTVAPSNIPHHNHNTNKDGCNPILTFDMALKNSVAGGAWRSCGRYVGGHFGLFDPPVPVTACLNGDCGNEGVDPALTTVPISIPAVKDMTTTPPPAAEPSKTADSIPSETALAVESPSAVVTEAPKTSKTPDSPKTSPAAAENPSATASIETSVGDPSPEQSDPATPPTLISSKAIATLPSVGILSAAPGDSSIVIGSQTITPGAPAITVSGGNVISIAPSGGVIVSNPDSGSITTFAFPEAPTPTGSIAIETLPGVGIISAAPDESIVVVGSQTLTAGSPAVTLPGGQVISVASSGVIVSNTDSSSVTTIPIPAAPNSTPIPQSIAMVAGQTISGAVISGSSVAVVGGQTLSIGGSAVTLSGDQVATLGSSGLVIEAPSGVVTTISILPTPEATATGKANAGGVPATSSSSGSVTATGLGGIIYATFEGEAARSSLLTDFGLWGWLASLTVGFMVSL